MATGGGMEEGEYPKCTGSRLRFKTRTAQDTSARARGERGRNGIGQGTQSAACGAARRGVARVGRRRVVDSSAALWQT